MAMDQIIRHGLEFSAGIDKASQKEMRKVVRDIFIEEAHIDLNNPENVQGLREFAETMQRIFAKAGKTTFDFSKIIKLPGPEMFAELRQAAMELEGVFGSMASDFTTMSDAFADGLVGGVQGATKQVEAEFDNLIKMQAAKMQELEELQAKMRKKEDMERRLFFHPENSGKAQIDDNFASHVSDVLEEYYDISDQLQDAIDQGKVTEPLLKKWIAVADELSRIKHAIKDIEGITDTITIKEPGSMFGTTKQIKRVEKLLGFNARFFTDGDYDDAMAIGMDAIADFIDTDEIQDKITIIEHDIQDLGAQINALTTQHPELISKKEVDETENRLRRIQEAYERLFVTRGDKKGEISSKKLQDIEKALSYQGKGGKIPALSQDATEQQIKQYKTAVSVAQRALDTAFTSHANSAGADWEERSRHLLRAIAEYESILNNPNADKSILAAHEDTYRQLKAQEAAARESLQTLLTMGQQKAASHSTAGSGSARSDMQIILQDMEKFLSSNTDKKAKDYFDSIATGAYEMSDEVRAAIEATIGSIGTLQSIEIGANNLGGLIGDTSALILRKPHFTDRDQQNENAIKLQDRLSQTSVSDVGVGKIQEIIEEEEYLVELQSKVSGAPLSTVGEAIETINPDVLNATEESIRSLIQAMYELYNAGIQVETENLGNILYDGQSGQFGIVDMDIAEGGRPYKSFEEMLSAFTQTVRGQVEDITEVLGNPELAKAWSRFADMVDGVVTAELQAGAEAIKETVVVQEELNNIQKQDVDIDDDAEVIEKENGALEDKLELLQEIAEQYGSNITQKQRDRYEELNQKDMNEGLTPKEDERYWELGEQIEEADNALEEFGQTYDKIIVKLENGKKIEILPDDKGLRTLAKIDEEYGESYNGVQIEDVIFERVKQEAVATEQAVDGLNESLEKTQQLTSGGTGDASLADLEAERAKAEALQDELDHKNGALQSAHDENEMLQSDLNIANEQIKIAQNSEIAAQARADAAEERAHMYDRAMTSMEEEMADLRGQLANAKTGGGDYESVSSEELKNVLNSIVYNVKIVHDDNDKTANKIALDDSTLEATLTKVFANILNPQTQQNDSAPKQEPWALENTLQVVKGVLDNIHTNTTKIGTVKPSNVDTIAGTALDGRLTEIKSVLESIDGKIAKSGVIATRGAVKQASAQPVESEARAQAARSNMMKSLINDYKTLGKLSAQFSSDENLETKAKLENLKEEISRKRKSLKLSMDESAHLRSQYSMAYDAEKRLLDAKKAQEEIDKKNKEVETDWKKRVKDAQRTTGINAATSVANAGDKTVLSAIGAEGVSTDIENKAKELSEQIKTLRSLRDEIADKGEKATNEDRDNLSKQISKVKELKTEVDGYLKIHEKYSGEGATQFNNVDTSNFGAVGTDQYWNNITTAIKRASDGRVTIKGMNTDTGELTGTTKIAANTFAQWSATVDPITGKLSMLRTGIKKTETIIEQIIRKTKEIFTYFSGSSIIFKAFNEIKKGIQYVREIDLALTELKKVTDETEENYDQFLKTAAKTADKVGSTIKDVVSSTADWARLGSVLA